tara:strand:+ start:129 stop:362 length:234 start_codon:yes stop_codon:yes gene_type:complete
MKYLLIAMAFNLQPITYSDKVTCEEARDILRAEAPLGQAGNILCIPAGEQEPDQFTKFVDLVMKLQSMEKKKLTSEE